MKKREKSGQMNLSFGMIFSIILIIVFISFAFYAIGKFLDIQKSAKTGQFIQAIESDVDNMWKSSSGSQEMEYSLPTSVDYLCFVDFSSGVNPNIPNKKEMYNNLKMIQFTNENLFFYPVGSAGAVDSKKINNINLNEITIKENPYCITNVKGKIKLTIKKGIDDALVTITR